MDENNNNNNKNGGNFIFKYMIGVVICALLGFGWASLVWPIILILSLVVIYALIMGWF